MDRIKNQRHSWGVFTDRYPDLYQALLKLDGSKNHQQLDFLCLYFLGSVWESF
ncbi:hypothetical protein KSP40_PGU001158 [Platanthera guangdongensis]|uniref:Uncharacterized protein n=1 Tax=Platanthera guangdongensis TaxID=2320717 RepID=A0ABR2LQN7_9ASPA